MQGWAGGEPTTMAEHGDEYQLRFHMLSCSPSHVPHAMGAETSVPGDVALNAGMEVFCTTQRPCTTEPPSSRSHLCVHVRLFAMNAVGDHVKHSEAVLAWRFTTTTHDPQILAVDMRFASGSCDAGVHDVVVVEVVDEEEDDFEEEDGFTYGAGGGALPDMA